VSNEECFSFSVPSQPQGKRISAEEAERLLLERLKCCEEDLLSVLSDLAYFYSTTGRQRQAQAYLERYISNTDDPEKRAGCYLGLGQLMEQMRDYESAISFYSRAFVLEPESTRTWYLIHNNLGFCLNHFERYSEAEGYCRSAIKIDPSRHNAYKNLGVSLAGQGDYANAAENLIRATKANASDGRALKLLEQLFAEHPEIKAEMPEIEERIQACRTAVKAVDEFRQQITRADSPEDRK
jgi:tetratricopeptide (TPR) repeat protein